jgi:uncharacterized protein (TIGR02453 family)
VAARHFGPELFGFLRDLEANNRREWFADNKARYLRDVEEPVRQFIRDVAPRLKAISPRFVADPRRLGGSMFRIHRDTRFSPDKAPFKTAVAARFKHDARTDDSVPGFYLHLEPRNSMGGGGIYHTSSPALRRIRERIAGAPREWDAVLAHGLAIEGDSLTRVPVGFVRDHPLAADLKRKDHYVLEPFSAAEVTSPAFLDLYVARCERVSPLVEFLARALGLRW